MGVTELGGGGGGGEGKGIRLLAEDSHYLDTENEFKIKPMEECVSLNISHRTEEKTHTLHTLYIYAHMHALPPPHPSTHTLMTSEAQRKLPVV